LKNKFEGREMYKKDIKKLYLLILLSSLGFGEIGLQEGMYSAAEEMIAFDNKMNKLIKEHNTMVFEDEEESIIEIKVQDFEEKKNFYILEKNIPTADNTKVDVKILNALLTVTIKSIEIENIKVEGERRHETIMSSSMMSLLIPNDADENEMTYSYLDGVLKIILPKK